MYKGYVGKTATEVLREFRTISERCFNKLHFWEDLRSLEKILRGKITFQFDDELFRWCACVVSGSRARGLEHTDSDLNVFFFYRGNIDENEIKEILDKRPLYHDKVQISVTPVRIWGDGSRIVEVLSAEEEYLAMRKAAYLTEEVMHRYYQDALQRILNRPRNLMVGMITEDLQAGNSRLFMNELEKIGCNDASLIDMLATYEPKETARKTVPFGRAVA